MPLETPDNETQDNSPSQQGPGARLRAEREARGQSLDAVSADTRITRTKLSALEDDDYERVGSNTFVIGYLRQYAKWLGLNADHLVSEYEAYAGQSRPQEVAAEASRDAAGPGTSTPGATGNGIPLLRIVAVILIIWVAAALWLNGGEPAEPASLGTEAATETATEIDRGAGAEPEALGATEETGATPPAAEPAQDQPTPVESGESVEDDAEQLAPFEAAPEPEATAADPEPAREADAVEPVGTDSLTLSVSGDCWVEVQDASGDRLVARLLEAGDNLRLTGQAPFSVMLGNSRVVSLQFNGQQVDTDPGPSRDTLRLTLGD